jgi:hypothetical protein
VAHGPDNRAKRISSMLPARASAGVLLCRGLRICEVPAQGRGPAARVSGSVLKPYDLDAVYVPLLLMRWSMAPEWEVAGDEHWGQTLSAVFRGLPCLSRM